MAYTDFLRVNFRRVGNLTAMASAIDLHVDTPLEYLAPQPVIVVAFLSLHYSSSRFLVLKLRHNLFRADLQMLHFVEHRIENDMLRAGVDEFLNLLSTFRRAAPDRHLRTKIGIFIAPAEPFANAPLAARFVMIYCQIDSLRKVKRRRITAEFGMHLPDPPGLAHKRSGRGRSRAHPAIRIFNRPPQRIFMMAAEDDRQPRLLYRLRLHGNIFKIPKLAMKAGLLLGPKQFHDFDCFREARHPPLPCVTEHIFMGAQVTAAQS